MYIIEHHENDSSDVKYRGFVFIDLKPSDKTFKNTYDPKGLVNVGLKSFDIRYICTLLITPSHVIPSAQLKESMIQNWCAGGRGYQMDKLSNQEQT